MRKKATRGVYIANKKDRKRLLEVNIVEFRKASPKESVPQSSKFCEKVFCVEISHCIRNMEEISFI